MGVFDSMEYGRAMKRIHPIPLLLLLLAGCGRQSTVPSAASGSGAEKKMSLAEARRGFQTKLVRREAAGEPLPKPPPALFRPVTFDAPSGKLAAFLSPDPHDGSKHPVIIWITGGDCNTLDDGFWKKVSANGDQTASGFREAGIPMMFPTLRGGNENPGFREGLFGEVDDVLAATDYLAKQPFVDPGRIYLGGISTGGTLVLLVASSSDRFRAVFAFGPADNVAGYSPEDLPFDTSNPREFELRSPIHWLQAIRVPVFVFEGTVRGNLASLRAMERASTNPKTRFHPVQGADHVTVLTPTTRLIAGKILKDVGPEPNIVFTEEELNRPFAE
jgi:acetyl esterase/lipase